MALTKVGKEGVTGISNSSNATAITIDSSENVGIGVTDPSTWSLGTALHIGNKENNLWGEADYAIHMSQNAYYNSGWKYSHTDEATRYSQEDGQHIWSYAGSGSANAALTWSEAMRVDSSGNVGINNSSPGSYYSNSNQLVVGSGSARQGITIASSTSTIGQLAFADGTSGDARYMGWVIYDHNTNHMSLGTSATERMRIDSSGQIMMHKSSLGVTTAGHEFRNTGVAIHSVNNNTCMELVRFGGTGRLQEFYSTSTLVGNISTDGSSTSYNTSSDYRLKENVTYDWDATTRLKQLKPARFNFIADSDTTVDGFLAHEAQTVVPEAVTGTHNEVDADGNPIMQGIDQSKIVPLLVKTILELEARITALETA